MIRFNEAKDYQYQVPDDHTHVQRLQKIIDSKDARLIAGKVTITECPLLDTDFEKSAEYIL